MMIGQEDTQRYEEPNKSGEFKVHYHLPGGMHQMDAFTRNKAEGELLALLKEVSSVLDLPFHIETQAYGEGGVVEYLNLIFQNKEQVAFIMAVLSPLLGAPFYFAKIKQTKQQTLLNTLNIEKLKLEIKEKESAAAERTEKKSKEPTSESLALEQPPSADDIAQALLARKKVARRRSNYYEVLLSDSEIEAVGFAPSHKSDVLEKVVPRSEFGAFVIARADLEPLIYEQLPVEIVSPVLRSGSIKWRGIFDKKIVSFNLQDEGFREQVSSQRVQFQNGTTLVCDFEVLQREDETGEIEIAGYAVTKVHEIKTPTGGPGKKVEEQLSLHLHEQKSMRDPAQ
jgi:hypothetical protein